MSTKTRRPQKLASKTGDDGYRHEKGCAWSGETLVRHPLSDRYCICDPHGTKARALEVAMEKYDRRHVLYQGEVWYPKNGDPVRLVDMSLRWKRNLLAFLERRAPTLQDGYLTNTEWSLVGAAEHATDIVMAEVQRERELAPVTWLYRTPLVLQLEQLIREEQDGPVDR